MFYSDNKGSSLPIVLILITIMLLVAITVLSVVNFNTKTVDNIMHMDKALSIAEAGYNKYLYLLSHDVSFYKYGQNEGEGFIISEKYDSSINPEWDGFVKKYEPTVYKIGSNIIGYYQIELTPPTMNNPVLGIKSTGWTSEQDKRTIYVEVHRRAFTDYLMFENAIGESVPFSSKSEIKGPYFTNGDLYALRGATFYDTVGYAGKDKAPDAIFKKEGQPVKMDPLGLPTVNEELTKWAKEKIGGLTYVGETYILLNRNKLTIKPKDGERKENIPIPESGVIYVKDEEDKKRENGDVYISGVLDGRLTIISDGNIYICAKDPTIEIENQSEFDNAYNYQGVTYENQNIPTYDKRDITNISDDMLGLVTDKDIIILNRTKKWPRATGGDRRTINTTVNNIKIQAALYCNSVTVQDLEYISSKDYGQIKYLGSRVIKEDAATGKVDYNWWSERHVGYSSENVYDYRMQYEAPPHYVEPTNAGWEVMTWKEISSD